jgi:hypothetical protein
LNAFSTGAFARGNTNVKVSNMAGSANLIGGPPLQPGAGDVAKLNLKLPSHPAAVNIVREFLSLLISGCLSMKDCVATLDNAAALINRNPDRDDVAISVAAWKQLSISSSGLAAVLALQVFTEYDPGLQRMRVRESTIDNMKKVFFYYYDFEQNSLFLKLFEVILASHVDPINAFHILDTDRDGLLTIANFIDMLRKLGLPLSESDKDCFHRYAEKSINLEEFLESFNRFRARRFGYLENSEQSLKGGKSFLDVQENLVSSLGEETKRNLFLKTNQYCF